ncbi:MAG: ArsR/SmtB family transcription factor [Candidatus Aenigmatarchaeota archaeon]
MEDAVKILKALSDETRFKIVGFLLDGEKYACEIISHVKKDQSTVSIHLGKLKSVGLLESRKDGRKAIYHIKDYRVCDIFRALGFSEGRMLKKACCMKVDRI